MVLVNVSSIPCLKGGRKSLFCSAIRRKLQDIQFLGRSNYEAKLHINFGFMISSSIHIEGGNFGSETVKK